jgi:hypothetical protein
MQVSDMGEREGEGKACTSGIRDKELGSGPADFKGMGTRWSVFDDLSETRAGEIHEVSPVAESESSVDVQV